MKSRVSFYFIVFTLLTIGFALCWHRHTVYNVPWLSDSKSQVWEIEARIQFEATGQPVRISLAKPDNQRNYTLIDERYSASDYGVFNVQDDENERIEWTRRFASGQQTLYYTAEMLFDPGSRPEPAEPEELPERPLFNEIQRIAGQTIINNALRQSADEISFTREIIRQINDKQNGNAVSFLEFNNRETSIIQLLSLQDIYAKKVDGLMLEDGRRRQQIQSMIQIWSGNEWHLFNPETGNKGYPRHFVIWNQSQDALLEVNGGQNSNISFSFISHNISPRVATSKKADANHLLNFSIHSLPVAEQSVFKTIMLIPIGALIVVFLRIIVGLKTSGTFMPVLIALAFVQTELTTGIIGFLLIVGTGLLIRGYLSRLNLLLVARISAVIISVVLIISLFSIIAFNIGLVEGLSITLFPMVILSWTIERMSILWEEEGPREVFIQGGGSLLTAVLVYLAMTNDLIEHLTFNFIGIQLVVLALILLIGNYTGYRLSEIYRFKSFIEEQREENS